MRGLYKVLDRIKAKYPDLPMMLCAGGGGRSDYEALKYFTEFWPSDNTDPIERLFIQWGYSQIFPSKTLCAHVTTWNRGTSIKFRTDVATVSYTHLEYERAEIFEFYINHRNYINDWDLIDSSSPYIVGEYLHDKPCDVLYRLAESESPWDNRIAMMATYTFIPVSYTHLDVYKRQEYDS